MADGIELSLNSVRASDQAQAGTPEAKVAAKRGRPPKAVAETIPQTPAPREKPQSAATVLKEQLIQENLKTKAQRNKAYRILGGYRRAFPKLSHNMKLTPDSNLNELDNEIASLQNQLADDQAPQNVKNLILFLLSLAEKQAVFIERTAGYNLSNISGVAAVEFDRGFMSKEVLELGILYPEYFRPGLFQRSLMCLFSLITRVDSLNKRGALYAKNDDRSEEGGYDPDSDEDEPRMEDKRGKVGQKVDVSKAFSDL